MVSLPPTAFYLMINPRFHPAYGLSWRKRLALALRMWRTTRNVWTGTSYKAHLAMAVKLFEIPPDEQGVVVECGCFIGGSTANLSLACALTGRQLIVYDSFAGLPSPRGNDRFARASQTGFLDADLEAVKQNVRDYGEIDVCTFREGWFSDTLPSHTEPIALAFLDVDYQSSLDDCIKNLWPHLNEQGYLFTDEYIFTEFCALFWSERYWRETFDTTPPGLIGSGSRDRRRAVLPRPGDRVELGPRPDQRGLHAQGSLGLLGLRPRVGTAARGARARRRPVLGVSRRSRPGGRPHG